MIFPPPPGSVALEAGPSGDRQGLPFSPSKITTSLVGLLMILVVMMMDDDYQYSPGLERTVCSSVSSLTSLHLDNNPLHCDCHLSWMAAWMTSTQASQTRNPNNQQQQQSTRTTRLTTSQAVNPNNKIRSSQRTICTTPGFLSGRKLADISQSAMVCTGSHRDPVQAR